MKRIAAGLLALAALLYVVATVLEPRHAGWSWVAAFAEAAMIGAIADWFAVVALFRRPLGLPIPHTAIIPTNKARIGRELGSFITGHFMQTPAVVERVRQFAPASQLAGWLKRPDNAAAVARHLAAALRHGLAAFDDERVRRFVGGAALAGLQRIDLAPLAGRMLDALTAERRHQAVLDVVLRQIAQLLGDEAVHAKIAQVFKQELRYLSLVGLDTMAGRLAARKMVSGVGRLIGEMGDDPEHPLRLRFDEAMAEFVQRLQNDPALAERADALKAELLAQPALAGYLHGLWDELLGWLRADLEGDDSSVRRRVEALAAGLGERLDRDEAMKQWIDDQILQAAPRWVERYRDAVGRYIAEHVEAWDTREMTAELERHIGRDLQFVRVNGTLVGGLIGLAIHGLTLWLRGS